MSQRPQKTSRRLTSHDDLPGPAHDWLGATVASPAPRPSLPHGKTDPGKQAHTALLVSPPQPQRSTFVFFKRLSFCASLSTWTDRGACAADTSQCLCWPASPPRGRHRSSPTQRSTLSGAQPQGCLCDQHNTPAIAVVVDTKICGTPHNNGLTHRHQSLRVAACRRSHGSGPTRSHRR